MARSPRQKQKLLLIREYLERYTDEEHPVSTGELIEYLAGRDVTAERKSIYDDMETLRAFGVDVERARRGITRKKSLELIGKIERLTSASQARGLRRQVWVKNRIKSMNESIYYLVDDLHAAIDGDRRIRFHYFQYDPRGKKQLRRGGAWYRISPYALLWDDENYYLVGYDSDKGEIRHFRVDKMTDLNDDGPGREGAELFAALDMSAYTNAHFGMFSGKTERVRLEFKNELSGAAVDRFGTDAILVPGREGTFTVTVDAAVNEPFFAWLCTFGDGVRILAPESAVQAMREHVRKILARYESEKEETP